MRVILILFTIIFNLNSFSQSKKEQIEILNSRVDSLNSVVIAERSSNQNKINELNSVITKLEGQIATLSGDLTTLNKELQDSKDDFLKKQKEIVENQKSIFKKDEEIARLNRDNMILSNQNNNYLLKIDSLNNSSKKTLGNYDIKVFWDSILNATETRNRNKLNELTFYPFLGHGLLINCHTHDELFENIVELKKIRTPVKSEMKFYGGIDQDGEEVDFNFTNKIYEIELKDGVALYFSEVGQGFRYIGFLYGE